MTVHVATDHSSVLDCVLDRPHETLRFTLGAFGYMTRNVGIVLGITVDVMQLAILEEIEHHRVEMFTGEFLKLNRGTAPTHVNSCYSKFVALLHSQSAS